MASHQSHAELEFFNIMVQTGSLIAVIIYFRKQLWAIFQSFFQTKAQQDELNPTIGLLQPKALLFQLILATIITFGGAFLALKLSSWVLFHFHLTQNPKEDLSEFIFRYPPWVALNLVLTGTLLLITEKISSLRDAIPLFKTQNALSMGSAQVCSALFHGLSRSGSTISAGLASGLDRGTATQFSFLLSLPTIAGAALYDAIKFYQSGHLLNFDWFSLFAGTVTAGIVGYFCVKYFVIYVARNSLNGFGFYCITLGTLLFMAFYTGLLTV